jgi:hypothetical protein
MAAENPTAELRLTSLTIPEEEMVRGLPVDFNFAVENPGDRAAHRVSVSLFEDHAKVLSKTFYTTIEPHSEKEYHWSWLPKHSGKFKLTIVLGSTGELPTAKQGGLMTKSQQVSVEDLKGSSLEISKVNLSAAKVDQEVTADVVVHNAGKLDAKDVKIIMLNDNVRLANSKSENVVAGGEGHFLLRWVPRSKGSQRVRFQVEGTGSEGRRVEKSSVLDVAP